MMYVCDLQYCSILVKLIQMLVLKICYNKEEGEDFNAVASHQEGCWFITRTD